MFLLFTLFSIIFQPFCLATPLPDKEPINQLQGFLKAMEVEIVNHQTRIEKNEEKIAHVDDDSTNIEFNKVRRELLEERLRINKEEAELLKRTVIPLKALLHSIAEAQLNNDPADTDLKLTKWTEAHENFKKELSFLLNQRSVLDEFYEILAGKRNVESSSENSDSIGKAEMLAASIELLNHFEEAMKIIPNDNENIHKIISSLESTLLLKGERMAKERRTELDSLLSFAKESQKQYLSFVAKFMCFRDELKVFIEQLKEEEAHFCREIARLNLYRRHLKDFGDGLKQLIADNRTLSIEYSKFIFSEDP